MCVLLFVGVCRVEVGGLTTVAAPLFALGGTGFDAMKGLFAVNMMNLEILKQS